MTNFICPVDGARLTSPFGWRNDPFGKNGKYWHQGVDLASPTPGKKVPIYASAAGTVTRVQPLSTYGKVVMILHTIGGKTYESNYAHLDSSKVKVGQKVKQGEHIATMGMTGSSTAVHLHFEIHNGRWATGQPNAVDPMKHISLKAQTATTTTASKPATTTKPKEDVKMSIWNPESASIYAETEVFLTQAVKDGIIQQVHVNDLKNKTMTTDRLLGLFITIQKRRSAK